MKHSLTHLDLAALPLRRKHRQLIIHQISNIELVQYPKMKCKRVDLKMYKNHNNFTL